MTLSWVPLYLLGVLYRPKLWSLFSSYQNLHKNFLMGLVISTWRSDQYPTSQVSSAQTSRPRIQLPSGWSCSALRTASSDQQVCYFFVHVSSSQALVWVLLFFFGIEFPSAGFSRGCLNLLYIGGLIFALLDLLSFHCVVFY